MGNLLTLTTPLKILLDTTVGENLKPIPCGKKENVYYNKEIIALKTWQKRHNLEGNIDVFFSDGVHPSKLTYQTWGKEMAQFIMKTKNLT